MCQLALESKAYRSASAVLNRDTLYLPGEGSRQEPKYRCSLHLASHQYVTIESDLTEKLSTQDVQEYFLLGGVILIGLKQWERAADFLENVITYPVKDSAVSKIMVEAYKKWVLVKTLSEGKLASLPSITNSNAVKIFHTIGKPYDAVATLFESGSPSKLNAEVSVNADIWYRDGNSGLVRCVLAAYQQHQIRSLSNVYATISVSRVSELTSSAEPEKELNSDEAMEELIKEMISCAELQGSLSRPSNQQPYLAFNARGELPTEVQIEEELADSMKRIQRMMEDIKVTDRLLTHEKEYLRWVVQQKKLGEANAASGYAEELGWNVGPDDEDLMAA